MAVLTALVLAAFVVATISQCVCEDAPQLAAGVDAYGRWYHGARVVPQIITRTRPPPSTLLANIAIIVPFRARAEHLRAFVAHIHTFMLRADAHYRLFVIEQADSNPFNRGALLNAGFHFASKYANEGGARSYSHFVFHDVDALPASSTLLPWYATPPPPGACYHLASPSWFEGKYTFDRFFGAVSVLRADSFVAANGFPASFWGWGGEDDALLHRLSAGCDGDRNATTVLRPRRGRFRHLPHPRENVEAGGGSRDHMSIARSVVRDQCRWQRDGLSSEPVYVADGDPVPLVARDELNENGGADDVVVGFLIQARRPSKNK